MRDAGFSRRDLLQRGSLLALPTLLGARAAAGPARGDAPAGLRAGPEVYRSIGVRPLINARGTYTILSGSLMLPEVRAAIDAAARHYVHLDELNDAIGARLAELTRAEWGLVTSGCSAALTHASAACVAGGNPDLHVRIPDLRGFAKDEAIIPRHSRNVYDAAVRAVGLRVVEVGTAEELQAALGPRTALVYVLAGPQADAGPLATRAVAQAAAARGVPVLVDAAAEVLTVPNVHLQNGATLVAYSGGKCLRGPQSAGLLLGRKDLVQAAWIHSAPHHGFARAMKVGKEEAIGMLMAVEMWTRRDHAAEWSRWLQWLEAIASRVATIAGVRTTVEQPEGLSNKTPSLRVSWDAARLGVTGEAVARHLFESDPRVALFPASPRGEGTETGVSITPYMLAPGEEAIVAERLHATLARPPRTADAKPAEPAADLSGTWDVLIEFAAGRSTHTLHLTQRGRSIEGVHQGDFVARDLTGSLDGQAVALESDYPEVHGDALHFRFAGTVAGDAMSGTLDMGEYRAARWSARRRVRGRG